MAGKDSQAFFGDRRVGWRSGMKSGKVRESTRKGVVFAFEG